MYKDVEDFFLNNVPDVSRLLERMNDTLTKSTNDILIKANESLNKSISKSFESFNSSVNNVINKAFNTLDTSMIFESALKSFSERLKSISNLVQSDSIIVLSQENTKKVNETIDKAVSVIPVDKDKSTSLPVTPLSKSIQKQRFWTLENIDKLLTILIDLLTIITLLISIKDEDQTHKIENNQTININYYYDDIQKDNKSELQDIQEEVKEAIQQIIENIEDNTQETTDDASTLDFPSEEY